MILLPCVLDPWPKYGSSAPYRAGLAHPLTPIPPPPFRFLRCIIVFVAESLGISHKKEKESGEEVKTGGREQRRERGRDGGRLEGRGGRRSEKRKEKSARVNDCCHLDSEQRGLTGSRKAWVVAVLPHRAGSGGERCSGGQWGGWPP